MFDWFAGDDFRCSSALWFQICFFSLCFHLPVIVIQYSFPDLSFNNIEVIEGLSKLSKIEDLTLYNNRISKIENLDTLANLHVFSIGNNDIKDIKDVCDFCFE